MYGLMRRWIVIRDLFWAAKIMNGNGNKLFYLLSTYLVNVVRVHHGQSIEVCAVNGNT